MARLKAASASLAAFRARLAARLASPTATRACFHAAFACRALVRASSANRRARCAMRASLSCSVLSPDVFFLRFMKRALVVVNCCGGRPVHNRLLIFSEYVNSGRGTWIGHFVSTPAMLCCDEMRLVATGQVRAFDARRTRISPDANLRVSGRRVGGGAHGNPRSHSKAKTFFQSSLMLTTVQPFAAASSRPLSSVPMWDSRS